MSEKLPVITGKEFIKLLEKLGFSVTRINGSHPQIETSRRPYNTVPVHKNDSLPKGLLRKILREDIKLTIEELKEYLH